MKLGRHLVARLLACGLCCPAFAAHGDTDPSFLLTATSSDFDRYFPTYLANGYLSTTTGPRGTESGVTRWVEVVDAEESRVSRPALRCRRQP
jgi:hypothetical protein